MLNNGLLKKIFNEVDFYRDYCIIGEAVKVDIEKGLINDKIPFNIDGYRTVGNIENPVTLEFFSINVSNGHGSVIVKDGEIIPDNIIYFYLDALKSANATGALVAGYTNMEHLDYILDILYKELDNARDNFLELLDIYDIDIEELFRLLEISEDDICTIMDDINNY